jgi:crossover junction endodeoxyribonuclease RuvC
MSRIREPPDPSELPKGGFVGVDPGADGTIGYTWGPGEGEFWRFDQMTDLETWDIFFGLSCIATAAALEKVGAMPGQGVSSTFKFGHGAGKVLAWLVAGRFRWDYVTPAKWQGALRCKTGGDKKITQAAAQKLWPHLTFNQKNSEGLLIAEWCRLHAEWAK